MNSIKNLVVFTLFVLSMVSCKKDNEFIQTNSTTSQKVVTSNTSHNHTQPTRKCASKAYMEQKLQDPIYKLVIRQQFYQ